MQCFPLTCKTCKDVYLKFVTKTTKSLNAMRPNRNLLYSQLLKFFRTEFISAKQHDSSLFWSRSTKIQTFKKNTLMF